jgi:hypothetical protein
MKHIEINGVDFHYLGPSLSVGATPTIFYFALSSKDTLLVDPYNQPISSFDLNKIRVITCTLLEHEEPKSPYEAIGAWVDQLHKGNDLLTPFFERVSKAIHLMLEKNMIAKDQLGFMGLSRGAFIATHLSRYFDFSLPIVGFSPLIALSQTKEALALGLNYCHLDLSHFLKSLIDKKIYYFIGNKDTRVGSKICADFIFDLANLAYEHSIRSLPFELKVFPSIGYMGHGTPKSIFIEGANLLKTIIDGSK